MVALYLVMAFGLFAGEGTKARILDLLSEKYPLTTTQIHKELEKKYSHKASYQAVHRALKELIEQGVIENAGGYFINHAWVRKWKIATEKLEIRLRENSPHQKKILEKNSTTIEFEKLIDVGKIALVDILSLPHEENTPFILLGRHIWPTMTLTGELAKRFERLFKEHRVYIMCESEGPIHKLNAAAYEKKGGKVIFKPKYSYFKDTIVFGDFVAYINFDPKVVKLFDELSKMAGLKAFNLKELFTAILGTAFTNKAIITKNSELAEQIRSEVLEEFGA
ncbi:MAG: hypothetical protein NUV67_04690 [archaeon]|nr:hypothetical protein [archaeon]